MTQLRYDIIIPADEQASLSSINYDAAMLNIIASDSFNKAALTASGEYICFFYSSAVLCPDFFIELDKTFAKPNAAAALFCTTACDTEVYYNPATLEAPCIDGAFAISRTAFSALDGFDKHLSGSAALTDLSLRLLLDNKIIYYSLNARVECKRANTDESFALIQYGRLLLSMKYESTSGVLLQNKLYFNAVKKPAHYDGVRRELALLYLKAAARLIPLCYYKLKNRARTRKARELLNDFLFLRRGYAKTVPPQGRPLVSVIVRACRHPELLREALMCLRNQTYKCLEIIVCEDNEPYSEKMINEEFSDLSIKYLCKNEHIGRSRNGNAGLAAANGVWCAFLDDDDLIYPEHIETLLSAAESEPDARLILGSAAAIYFEQDGDNIRRATALRPMVFDRIDVFTMCQACRIPIQTALFKRELYEEAGGLHEGLNANEDWAMWLKFLAKSPRGKATGADITRITSLFAQPANAAQAAQRLSEYKKDNAAFYSDASLSFNVSLQDMRNFYNGILADIEHLQGRGELTEFLENEKKKYR